MSETKEMTGVIAAISKKEGKPVGFLIGESWFNSTKATVDAMGSDVFQKGDKVSLKYRENESGGRMYHNVTECAPADPQESLPEAPAQPKTQDPKTAVQTGGPISSREVSIVRQVCMKAAAPIVAELVKRDEAAGTKEASQWMKDIGSELEKWINR